MWTSRASDETRKANWPKLVPVRLSSVAAAPSMLRLVLRSGVVLEISEHADPARCRALLGGVQEALR